MCDITFLHEHFQSARLNKREKNRNEKRSGTRSAERKEHCSSSSSEIDGLCSQAKERVRHEFSQALFQRKLCSERGEREKETFFRSAPAAAATAVHWCTLPEFNWKSFQVREKANQNFIHWMHLSLGTAQLQASAESGAERGEDALHTKRKDTRRERRARVRLKNCALLLLLQPPPPPPSLLHPSRACSSARLCRARIRMQ